MVFKTNLLLITLSLFVLLMMSSEVAARETPIGPSVIPVLKCKFSTLFTYSRNPRLSIYTEGA